MLFENRESEGLAVLDRYSNSSAGGRTVLIRETVRHDHSDNLRHRWEWERHGHRRRSNVFASYVMTAALTEYRDVTELAVLQEYWKRRSKRRISRSVITGLRWEQLSLVLQKYSARTCTFQDTNSFLFQVHFMLVPVQTPLEQLLSFIGTFEFVLFLWRYIFFNTNFCANLNNLQLQRVKTVFHFSRYRTVQLDPLLCFGRASSNYLIQAKCYSPPTIQ